MLNPANALLETSARRRLGVSLARGTAVTMLQKGGYGATAQKLASGRKRLGKVFRQMDRIGASAKDSEGRRRIMNMNWRLRGHFEKFKGYTTRTGAAADLEPYGIRVRHPYRGLASDPRPRPKRMR